MKKEDDDLARDDITNVREKASHRKGRTTEVVRSARVPTQERSKKRYQAILDATLEILQSANIEDISLHDIGRVTGLPAPSVHYLFNTVTAIFIELNKIFNEQLTKNIIASSQNLEIHQLGSWQDLVRSSLTIARNELNSNRAMSEIMLGPIMHRSMRVKNLETNRYHGAASLELLEQYFSVPAIPNMATYLMFSAELVDGLWCGAYARYGAIDDETFAESVRANLAYLRCYFPETMVVRRDM
ncbi:TetR/AcrR family transcriptional regulator [Pseudomonas protegens]